MSRLSHTALWAITLLVSALLLCTVGFINGGPIVYPDTALYIADGERVLHFTAPLAVRPVFYGVAIFFLHWGLTVWPILIAQGLAVTHIIWLTYRVVGASLRPLPFVALMILLALFTPLSWHTSHVLPDIFAGVLILALFLLGFCRHRLGRLETAYLFLLSAASICFHLTNLVVALGLCCAILAVWAFWRPLRTVTRPVLAAGPIALALLAFFSLSLIVYQRLTLTPNSPPHLMARLIMDGPGRDYLRAVCPTATLTICKYQDQIPDGYEPFLWVFMNQVPVADGKQIRAEEGAVVRGTVTMFPFAVAWHMLANTATQLVTLESKTDFPPPSWAALDAGGGMLARDVRGSLQSRGLLDGDALDPLNFVHAVVALVSFVACLLLIRSCFASRLYWPAGLVLWALLGMLANAFAGGALSGPFGRYQGRIIWLLPMAAAAAAIALARSRPPLMVPAARARERVT
ncbi:MAG: hypothetical protein JOZ05_07595 [Acetobacteraceae bacterium]|nr:hypothetical protein [Acetobacteraceae bacterium]